MLEQPMYGGLTDWLTTTLLSEKLVLYTIQWVRFAILAFYWHLANVGGWLRTHVIVGRWVGEAVGRTAVGLVGGVTSFLTTASRSDWLKNIVR